MHTHTYALWWEKREQVFPPLHVHTSLLCLSSKVFYCCVEGECALKEITYIYVMFKVYNWLSWSFLWPRCGILCRGCLSNFSPLGNLRSLICPRVVTAIPLAQLYSLNVELDIFSSQIYDRLWSECKSSLSSTSISISWSIWIKERVNVLILSIIKTKIKFPPYF